MDKIISEGNNKIKLLVAALLKIPDPRAVTAALSACEALKVATADNDPTGGINNSKLIINGIILHWSLLLQFMIPHTNTHTQAIFLCICVCVCVFLSTSPSPDSFPLLLSAPTGMLSQHRDSKGHRVSIHFMRLMCARHTRS